MLHQKNHVTEQFLEYCIIDIRPYSDNQLKQLASLLNNEERTKQQRFVQKNDKTRYMLAHITLRKLLSAKLNCQACELSFQLERFGKPTLIHHRWHFNISHSGSYILIGLSEQVPIGIDVDGNKALNNYKQLAKRFFHREEYQAINELNEVDGLKAFFRCWTRKEAISKALGLGLQIDFSSFQCSVNEHPAVTFPDNSSHQQWTLHNINLPTDNYFASIATPFSGYTIQQIECYP